MQGERVLDVHAIPGNAGFQRIETVAELLRRVVRRNARRLRRDAEPLREI